MVEKMFALGNTALLLGVCLLATLIGMQLKAGRDVSPCALVTMSGFLVVYDLLRMQQF